MRIKNQNTWNNTIAIFYSWHILKMDNYAEVNNRSIWNGMGRQLRDTSKWKEQGTWQYEKYI